MQSSELNKTHFDGKTLRNVRSKYFGLKTRQEMTLPLYIFLNSAALLSSVTSGTSCSKVPFLAYSSESPHSPSDLRTSGCFCISASSFCNYDPLKNIMSVPNLQNTPCGKSKSKWDSTSYVYRQLPVYQLKQISQTCWRRVFSLWSTVP